MPSREAGRVPPRTPGRWLASVLCPSRADEIPRPLAAAGMRCFEAFPPQRPQAHASPRSRPSRRRPPSLPGPAPRPARFPLGDFRRGLPMVHRRHGPSAQASTRQPCPCPLSSRPRPAPREEGLQADPANTEEFEPYLASMPGRLLGVAPCGRRLTIVPDGSTLSRRVHPCATAHRIGVLRAACVRCRTERWAILVQTACLLD